MSKVRIRKRIYLDPTHAVERFDDLNWSVLRKRTPKKGGSAGVDKWAHAAFHSSLENALVDSALSIADEKDVERVENYIEALRHVLAEIRRAGTLARA